MSRANQSRGDTWGLLLGETMKVYIKYLVNKELFDDLKSAENYKAKLEKLGNKAVMQKLTRTLYKDTFQLMI